MIRIFLPDGGPDAEDFDNNYFTYDESHFETTARINYILKNCDTLDPEKRLLLRTICAESLHKKPQSKPLKLKFPCFSYALNILQNFKR